MLWREHQKGSGENVGHAEFERAGRLLEERLQDELWRDGSLPLSQPALPDRAGDPSRDDALLGTRLVPVRQVWLHVPFDVKAGVSQQREAAVLQLRGVHLVLRGGEDEDGRTSGGRALVSWECDGIDQAGAEAKKCAERAMVVDRGMQSDRAPL